MYVFCSFFSLHGFHYKFVKIRQKTPEQKITVRQGTKGLIQQCHAEHQDSPLSLLALAARSGSESGSQGFKVLKPRGDPPACVNAAAGEGVRHKWLF